MTKRKLLASVITSKILYIALVWVSRAVRFQTNKVTLGRAQRIAALQITRCYRMVEILPADLLAVERKIVRNRRKAEPDTEAAEITEEARAATFNAWQNRWASEATVAAWTRQVLPSIYRWIGMPQSSAVTFHLAQAFTG